MSHELLVYESKPLNAAALARLADLQLCEVRSLMQLKQALSVRTPRVVAVEVPEEEDRLMEVLTLIQDAKAAGAAVVAMPTTDSASDRLLYEAGADFVFRSMLNRRGVAALLRRASRLQTSGSQLERSVRDQIWARLPWKRHATGGSR